MGYALDTDLDKAFIITEPWKSPHGLGLAEIGSRHDQHHDDYSDEEVWGRAYPRLGHTMHLEDFQQNSKDARLPRPRSRLKRYRLNIWAASENPSQKIDGIASSIMALLGWMLDVEQKKSVYTQRACEGKHVLTAL